MPRSFPSVVLTSIGLLALPVSKAIAQEQTHIGGYGEIHYNNASGPNTPGRVTVARFVIYLAHTFSDRLVMHSEVEIEDTKIEAGGSSGEVALEQVYLDYRLADALTLRTGLVLPPVGIINEVHEPPTFNGVERPAFDHDVIPTTWREIGVGAVGTLPAGLTYRVYLVNGLVAAGFTGAEGIRDGRQEGQDASFANPSLTGRLEWARPGLKIGGAFWYGGSANQDTLVGVGRFDAPVALLSADARYERGPFALRAVVANVTVGDAGPINQAYGTDVGSRIAGGYIEGSFDVLALLAPATTQRLHAFARYEQYDTHAAVPAGTTRNDAYARRYTTVGLTYRPVNNLAFKGDMQLQRNRAGVGEQDVLSLGVGYAF